MEPEPEPALELTRSSTTLLITSPMRGQLTDAQSIWPRYGFRLEVRDEMGPIPVPESNAFPRLTDRVLRHHSVRLRDRPLNVVPTIFVRSIGGRTDHGASLGLGPEQATWILMPRFATRNTLAHEVGHTLGLAQGDGWKHSWHPLNLMFVSSGGTRLTRTQVKLAEAGLCIRNGTIPK